LASEDRYTFSQVMSSLIELESMIAKFYRASAERSEPSGSKEIFLAFEKVNRQRIDSLDRVRRETVVEMSLEPIAGLGLGEHMLHVKRMIEGESLGDAQKAIALEGVMKDIYRQASRKLEYVSAEACELLNKFSMESSRRRDLLVAGNQGLKALGSPED